MHNIVRVSSIITCGQFKKEGVWETGIWSDQRSAAIWVVDRLARAWRSVRRVWVKVHEKAGKKGRISRRVQARRRDATRDAQCRPMLYCTAVQARLDGGIGPQSPKCAHGLAQAGCVTELDGWEWSSANLHRTGGGARQSARRGLAGKVGW